MSSYPSVFPSPLAGAIANAEGFNNGSAGTPLNNPGNIESNGQLNQYGSLEEGWAALESQINKWMNGSSAYAGPNTSINDLAQTYTGGDNPQGWAAAVSQYLGVDPNTTLGQIVRGHFGQAAGTYAANTAGRVINALLSQRFVLGFLGAMLIIVGALGFDRTQDIVVQAGKKAAEGAAAA